MVTRDVLYTDDTLLVLRHPSNVQAILNKIVSEGARYGLEMNWDKTVQMQVSTCGAVTRPCGAAIKCVREAVYLGGLITCDGRATREISRRLGESSRTFDQLQQVWKHAAITTRRKIEIYKYCVVAKLLYSLDSLWLVQVDRRRLDAFHCRCLRRMLRIPHAYYSRVSNHDVLARAMEGKLSDALLKCQVRRYCQIQSLAAGSLVKRVVCNDHGAPIAWASRRCRGRSRQRWASEVFKLLAQHAS